MHDKNYDPKRRFFLKSAVMGVSTVSAMGFTQACTTGFITPYEGDALELWHSWQNAKYPKLYSIVAAAILAPSPHNTQPWRFNIFEQNIELFDDTTRNLGSFDPYLREMYFGLGCAIENIVVAAKGYGFDSEISLMPDANDQSHVASIRLFQARAHKSELFHVIDKRHTHRGAYDKQRRIPAQSLERLHKQHNDPETNLALFTAQSQHGQLFVQGTINATKAIIADKQMALDSYHWYRHTKSEMENHRDGATLLNAGLTPLMHSLALLLPKPDVHESHEYWLKATRERHCATAPMFGLIKVRELYNKEHTLKAGRLWQRIHLQATSLGIAMQPINQLMEWVDRQRSTTKQNSQQALIKELNGDPDWHVTFGFRFGYAQKPAPPSPRRKLMQVIQA